MTEIKFWLSKISRRRFETRDAKTDKFLIVRNPGENF